MHLILHFSILKGEKIGFCVHHLIHSMELAFTPYKNQKGYKNFSEIK